MGLLYWCISMGICIEINSLNSKDTSLNPIVSVVASSNLHNPAKDQSLTNHALFNPLVSVSSISSHFNALNSATNDILNLIDYDDDDDDINDDDDDDINDDDDDDDDINDDDDDDDDDDTYADAADAADA